MNIKNTLNSMTLKKRKGFGLIMAIIVSAVGLLLVAMMFESATDFSHQFSDYRHEYVDEITSSSYIEQAKGRITAANLARSAADLAVLHGVENQDANFAPNQISNLDGLLIEDGFGLRNENINVNGPQRVEVRVLDANYLLRSLMPTFPDDDILGLPPSYFATGNIGQNAVVEIGDSGETYDKENAPPPGADFFRYGAYLVQVRIFSMVGGAERLIRTTEEAFVQLMPQ